MQHPPKKIMRGSNKKGNRIHVTQKKKKKGDEIPWWLKG